jgi:hypothetical protein
VLLSKLFSKYSFKHSEIENMSEALPDSELPRHPL